MREIRRDIPIVLIRRPKSEVLASLDKFPYPKQPSLSAWFDRMNQRLDRIEDDLDCMSLPFWSLKERTVCAEIFKECLGQTMPLDWWEKWNGTNVQCDVLATVKMIKEKQEGWMAVFGPRYAEQV